jgi:hypothetical protein
MLNLDEGGPLGLGLDHSRRLPINKEQVVDTTVTRLKDELPDCYSGAGGQVDLVDMLDDPTGVLKLPVDLDSRSGLGREVGAVWVSHGP